MKPFRRILFSILILSFAACGIIEAGDASKERPNIVFILADDMGSGDLACQNPESKIPTPHLDRLASQGVRFTDAHSPSAVCTPTRYGILTGRYCWRSPLKDAVLWPWDEPIIEEDRLTVAKLLKQNGYDTACVGKWHLGWDWETTDNSRINDELPVGKHDKEMRKSFGWKVDFKKPVGGGPTTRGFDYYFGDDVPNFPPYCFIENDRTLGVPSQEKPEKMFGSPGPMLEDWDLVKVMPTLTQKAVDYIKAPPGTAPFNKRKDTPFFLYFSLTAPHTPIAPAPEFIGKSQAGAYGDFVNEVDWTVGQVVTALEETGQAENTLLIFTSDNGSPGRDGTNMSGRTNSVREFGHNPSYIYRGIKTDIWEGGHRVPFIAKWPGHTKPGALSEETICHVDFMATCAAILGVEIPETAAEDSYNILPVLLGESLQEPIREATVHHSYYGMFAIRQGKWKLVVGKGGGGWDKRVEGDAPPVQLYDMESDVSETMNLCDEHPEIVEQLQVLLEKYQKEGRSTPKG